MVTINSNLKNFIKEYQHLIAGDNFEALYILWQREKYGKTAQLTSLLYSANINPLLYMNEIPSNFLYGIDPLSVGPLIDQILDKNNGFIVPSNIKTIQDDAFSYCKGIKYIYIPKSIVNIVGTAFSHMYDLEYIDYEGTKEQWKSIIKDEEVWNFNSNNLSIIKCKDGDIYL